jgi:hypothetical protein
VVEPPVAGPANDALVDELERALELAREQQALLRSSLTTAIGFLDRAPDPHSGR